MVLDSMKQIFECSEQEQIPFWEVVLHYDMDLRQVSRQASMAKMLTTWEAIQEAADTYTGYKAGLRVEEGTFSFKLSGSTAWGVALSNKKSSDLFGKDNKVVVTKTGVLEVNTWCSTFDNPVEITAHAADVALVATGTQTTWTGKITSDSDFTLQFTQWNDANGKPSNFTLGEISAPGKTVTLLSRDGMWG